MKVSSLFQQQSGTVRVDMPYDTCLFFSQYQEPSNFVWVACKIPTCVERSGIVGHTWRTRC
jgi:hypothetical protein